MQKIDLSKAFLTLDRLILLIKLEYYGICNNTSIWFYSYLSERVQFVVIIVCFHSSKNDLGVAQGYSLGPLLFNLIQLTF